MEELLKLSQSFGWMAVAIAYVIYKAGPKLGDWISKLGDTYVERKVNDVTRLTIEKHDLLSHRFFCYMDRCIVYYIDGVKIDNEYKEAICKDFLKIKFKVFVEGIHKIFSDDTLYTKSFTEFEHIIEKEILALVKKYNQEAQEFGIPELFINKFDKWHEGTMRLTLDMIRDICQSKWIIGNDRSAMSILNILVAAFEMTLLDAEKTLKYLNGDFVGQEYKGIICKSDH